MATLTIKNMPDELYQGLKKQAKQNHRSLNSEAIVSLSLALDKNYPTAETILMKARSLRIKENSIIKLNDEVINNAKEEGRS